MVESHIHEGLEKGSKEISKKILRWNDVTHHSRMSIVLGDDTHERRSYHWAITGERSEMLQSSIRKEERSYTHPTSHCLEILDTTPFPSPKTTGSSGQVGD